jgi:hypothetical protein
MCWYTSASAQTPNCGLSTEVDMEEATCWNYSGQLRYAVATVSRQSASDTWIRREHKGSEDRAPLYKY